MPSFQLENEFQKASLDASRSGKALDQQIDNFEAKKLKDVKVRILCIFYRNIKKIITNFYSLDNLEL